MPCCNYVGESLVQNITKQIIEQLISFCILHKLNSSQTYLMPSLDANVGWMPSRELKFPVKGFEVASARLSQNWIKQLDLFYLRR